MLTGAEKKYLALTAFFLLTGTGIKAYKQATVKIGPFDESLNGASRATEAAKPSGDSTAQTASEAADALSSVKAPADARLAQASFGMDVDGMPEPEKGGSVSSIPGQASGGAAGNAPSEKIPLNQADASQLMTVKGIGEKTAAAILQYRRAHGSFRSWSELTKVKGIGAKKLEKIKPYLSL